MPACQRSTAALLWRIGSTAVAHPGGSTPRLGVVLRSWARASTGVTAGVMDGELVDERSLYRKLCDATEGGDIPLMRSELAAGADPNMIEGKRLAPLQSAAVICRPEAVAELLSAGARADISADRTDTPLILVFLVHKNKERKTRTIVNDLISAGADVHARSQRRGATCGACPFSLALEGGFRWILLDLLRAGAEVNTVLRSKIVPATDTTPSFERTIEVTRSVENASAWALVDAIKKAGDFDEYARRQLNGHISMLTKCFGTALPVDAWSHVAGFYAPRGGY